MMVYSNTNFSAYGLWNSLFSFDPIVAASAASLTDTKGTTHTDEKVSWVNPNILKN